MPDQNLFALEWEVEYRPPFAVKTTRIVTHAGARDIAGSLYELGPGGAVSPYHLHHANEEVLTVLAGRRRQRRLVSRAR